ncbi:hypothetical protein DFR56_104251, partial [Pseudogracilibacillus auburnensis]
GTSHPFSESSCTREDAAGHFSSVFGKFMHEGKCCGALLTRFRKVHARGKMLRGTSHPFSESSCTREDATGHFSSVFGKFMHEGRCCGALLTRFRKVHARGKTPRALLIHFRKVHARGKMQRGTSHTFSESSCTREDAAGHFSSVFGKFMHEGRCRGALLIRFRKVHARGKMLRDTSHPFSEGSCTREDAKSYDQRIHTTICYYPIDKTYTNVIHARSRRQSTSIFFPYNLDKLSLVNTSLRSPFAKTVPSFNRSVWVKIGNTSSI